MTETLAAWTPRALSILRIITGLLIIQHGMAKILGFPVFPAYARRAAVLPDRRGRLH